MTNRHSTAWVKRIAVTVAATASLGMVNTAMADVFSDYQNNLNALQSMFQNKGKLPLFSDKANAAIIRNLTDQKQLQRINFSDDATAVGAMQGPCAISGQLTLLYLGQGIDFAHADRAQIANKLNENGYRYQDEVSASQSFATACMGKAIPVLAQGLQEASSHTLSAEQKANISKFRASTVSIITGVLEASKDANIKPANREKLLQSLATAMPNLISPLPLNTRLQLKAAADEAKASIPAQQKHYLNDISRSIETAACTNACQLIVD